MSHCHPPRILDTAKSIPVGTLRWVGPKRLDHPGDDTLHAAHASHPANGVKSTRWTLVLCPLHFLGKATGIRQRSTAEKDKGTNAAVQMMRDVCDCSNV